MTTILTHMYRVRAILALLLFLSSASLWAQSDDATLINITTLTQLDAIRYDLNGDGVVSFTTAASLTGSPMFSDRAAVVAVMGDTSAYAEAFTSGDFYTTAAATTAATGAVAVSTTYYYKLSSMATSPYIGYELRNNLDFEDANGNGTADDKSIWAEGASGAAVSGAVAEGWEPLGYYIDEDDNASYTATFDGRGHTISNLYINRPSTNYVGLFGDLGSGSNVRNLGIEGGSLSGNEYVGGLVGFNVSGRISACYATGDASGSGSVGGLVGWNLDGTISACYATGDASGSGSVGGLVGWNLDGTISACYATGNATGGSDYVGGLVGNNTGAISACYATGDATGDEYVGGLVGYNESTISACYATGDASGASYVGGLVGYSSSATVTNSYFDSTVSNRTDSDSYDKTTAQLQTPTAYGTSTDIYANWNIDVDNYQPIGVDDGTAAGDAAADDPWDFGTDSEYPALRVDFNVNGTPTAFEFGGQGRAVPVVPSAPTDLTATPVSDTQINLSWTTPTDGGSPLTGYKLQWNKAGQTAFGQEVTGIGSSATSYEHTGLERGTVYSYRLIALNNIGESAPSNQASEPTHDVPAAPTGLTATPVSDTQINLRWEAPTNTGGAPITGYQLQVSEDGVSFNDLHRTNGTTLSYQHGGLSGGATRHYQVAAINSAGSGTYASPVSATTLPSAPTDLTATPVSATQINLRWVAPTNTGGAEITGYKIQFSSPDASNFRDLRTTSGSTTTYQHTGLTRGTTYYYQVAAINSVDQGTYSSSVSATTHDVPSVPTGLTATPVSDTQINLSWHPPTNTGGVVITGYQLQVSEDGTTFTDLHRTNGTTLSYEHGGLSRGTIRHYVVAAINSLGTGAYTSSVSATTYDRPAIPVALAATPVSDTQINLRWEAPTNTGGATITGYQLQVSEDGTTFTDLHRTNGTTLSYEHRGLSGGATRHYQVAAINSAGSGTYASPVSATTLPSVPTGLTATPASDTQINLRWVAPTNTGGVAITGYQLQVSEDGTTFTDLHRTNGTTLSYEHRGIPRGTTRYYQIAAISSVGRGAYSSPMSATTHDVPVAPTNLTATPVDDTKINLSWQPPTNTGGAEITGYKIQFSSPDASNFRDLRTTSGSTTTYQHTGLTRGTTYYYQVAAINSVDRGAYSSSVSTTTHDLPGVPRGLTATPASDTQINLTWQPPTNTGGVAITGYQLQVSEDGTTFTDLHRTNGTTLSYEHTGLMNGTTYYYQVAAINRVDRGALSTTASATTPVVPPAAPTNLTATPASDTQIDLSWQPPTNTGGAEIIGYKIQFSSPDASNFRDLRTTSGSTTTYQHTGLTRGTTYYYQVAAINSVDQGAYSSSVSTTTHDLPGVPRGLTATPDGIKINLSWQAPDDDGGTPITGYKIQFSSPDASNFRDLRTTSGSTTTYQHTGLTADTEYHYQVAAINSVDRGAYSSSVSTTTHDVPGVPRGLTATPDGYKDKPLLAASYQHRRCGDYGLQDTVLFS